MKLSIRERQYDFMNFLRNSCFDLRYLILGNLHMSKYILVNIFCWYLIIIEFDTYFKNGWLFIILVGYFYLQIFNMPIPFKFKRNCIRFAYIAAFILPNIQFVPYFLHLITFAYKRCFHFYITKYEFNLDSTTFYFCLRCVVF